MLDNFSNAYDWRPDAPVSLFHGRDDQTVTYLDASSTLDAVRAKGSTAVLSLTECTAQPAGHLECGPSY